MQSSRSVVSSAGWGSRSWRSSGRSPSSGQETNRRWLLALAKPIATASLLLIVGAPPTYIVEKLDGLRHRVLDHRRRLPRRRGRSRLLRGHVGASSRRRCSTRRRSGRCARPSGPSRPSQASSSSCRRCSSRTCGAPRARCARPSRSTPSPSRSWSARRSGRSADPCPRWPRSAPRSGAVLFYISDATLAWDKFKRPVRHASFVTMGVYWWARSASRSRRASRAAS